jgi:hypothetical protein
MRPDLAPRPDGDRALAVDAATRPTNIAIGAVVAVAGIVLATPWLIGVALACYAALVSMTFLDESRADRTGGRVDADRDEPPLQLAADAPPLAPEIAARLDAAHAARGAIEQAIADADLPAGDIRDEMDALLATPAPIAVKADRVGDYLASHPARDVQSRIAALGADDRERARTLATLQGRLAAIRRVRATYDGLLDEMDRVVAWLEALHDEVVALGAADDESQQREVAGQVRALREGVQVLSGGMEEAYAETRSAARPPG